MHLRLTHGQVLSLDRPRIAGVLNLTPDSFSDGGAYADADAAVTAAQRMVEQGADLIDLGGESTRPGAARIDPAEQCRRILPVIERLDAQRVAPLSVDTTRRTVAEAALDAGATMINDISAGRDEPDLLKLIAERDVPYIIMHMQGTPASMQADPQYDDVVEQVLGFLHERIDAALAGGVAADQLIIDPGIGFGKTTEHNLQLLAALDRFVAVGRPIMLGSSRKRFIGQITGLRESTDRDPATAATTALGVMAGVHLFRVHNVAHNRQAADVAYAVKQHQATRDRVAGS
jgi:dihydropteroate synthase